MSLPNGMVWDLRTYTLATRAYMHRARKEERERERERERDVFK